MLGYIESIVAGRKRRTTFRQLMQLNDHLLSDIGLIRGDVASLAGVIARPNLAVHNGHE